MTEEMTVPVKGIEMDIDKGQGAIAVTIGPMVEKKVRAIAAAAAAGKLKIIIG